MIVADGVRARETPGGQRRHVTSRGAVRGAARCAARRGAARAGTAHRIRGRVWLSMSRNVTVDCKSSDRRGQIGPTVSCTPDALTRVGAYQVY